MASCSGSSDYAYCDCSYIFNGDGLDKSPGFRGGIQFRSKCRLSCSTAQQCACLLARPRAVGVCSRWRLADQAAAWGPSRIPVSRHTCFSVGVPPVIHGTPCEVDWSSGLASELGAGGTCSPTRSGRVPVLTSSGGRLALDPPIKSISSDLSVLAMPAPQPNLQKTRFGPAPPQLSLLGHPRPSTSAMLNLEELPHS